MSTVDAEQWHTQIGLIKNLLLNVLQINWHNIMLLHQYKQVHVPQYISIALKDKLRMWKAIVTGSYSMHMMIK